MPSQDPDLPDPDEWLEGFTSRLRDIANLTASGRPLPPGATPQPMPGLLGSLRDLQPQLNATGGGTSQDFGVAGSNPGSQSYPSATQLEPLVVLGKSALGLGGTLADIAGKVWASPYSALGLLAAGAGYAIGKVVGTRPDFKTGNNAIQITGLPFGKGALTLGNVQLYMGGATPKTIGRHYAPGLRDIFLGDHEEAHTHQYQVLGPAFAPLYLFYGGFRTANPFETSADYYGAHQGGPFSGFKSGPLAPLRNRPR
jgi:hypothetical protein